MNKKYTINSNISKTMYTEQENKEWIKRSFSKNTGNFVLHIFDAKNSVKWKEFLAVYAKLSTGRTGRKRYHNARGARKWLEANNIIFVD